jgi:nitrous oxidase accessory protein NosD
VKGRGLIALIGAVLGLAVAAPAATAATWRVNDDALPAGCVGQYPDISTAVAAPTTMPGDTIIVCAGVYNDNPFVNKARLTIRSQNPPPDFGTCNATRTDLTTAAAKKKYSIVNGGFYLAADKITVDGLVIQNGSVGVWTDPSTSGYVIQNNQIQDQAYDGVILDASGAFQSRVASNCLRNTTTFDGLFSTSLSNALIQGNKTFMNGEAGFALAGFTPPSKVTIQGNIMTNDPTGIAISASTTSLVQGNIINGSTVAGICLGESNNGLLVQGNIIKTAVSANGVFISSACLYSSGSTPNTGLKIIGNIGTSGNPAFLVDPSSMQNSTVTGNIFKSTAGTAMWITAPGGPGGNSGNKMTGNVATGATGAYGCRDDTGPLGPGTAGTWNTWGDSNIGRPHNSPAFLCFPHV